LVEKIEKLKSERRKKNIVSRKKNRYKRKNPEPRTKSKSNKISSKPRDNKINNQLNKHLTVRPVLQGGLSPSGIRDEEGA
jgi:hypothetical protein